MKLRIERDALADAVAWTSRAISSRGPGASSGIGIATGKDSVTFTSFDRDTSAQATFDAVVEEAGDLIVPARLLGDISKALPAAPVVISTRENNLEVTCGRSAFTLPIVQGGQFPAMMELPPAIGTMSGDAFAEAVGQVAPSASDQDSLKHLTGVLMEFSASSLMFAATDRFRLAMREADWTPSVAEPANAVLVPAVRAAEIAKGMADCETVTIFAPASGPTNHVGFSGKAKNGNTRSIVTTLVAATFPEKYRDLPPRETPISTVVNTADLLAAVRRVRLVLDASSSTGKAFIAFSIGEEDDLNLVAQGDVSTKAQEVVGAINNGTLDRVQFNPAYLMDGLNAIGTPYVQLGFTEAKKPSLITGMKDEKTPADNGFRYLLMPMSPNG